MADLMSVLQANSQPPQGWGSVGQALAGLSGAGREDSYNRGMAKAAQLDQLVQTARFSREKAMEAEDARKGRGGFAPAAIAAGIPEAQAGLLSSALMAGYDPTKVSGYLGDTQEQGFREGAVARALAGDFGGGNAHLMGVANGPVELASVQGQNLIANRLLEGGGGITTTEQGRAGISADAARAAAAYASANNSNASAARTRQATTLDRADTIGGGGGRAGMKAPSGYRWAQDGRLEAIPGGPADKPAGSGASEDERKAAGWLGQATRALGNMEESMYKKDANGRLILGPNGRPVPTGADTPGLLERYLPSEELSNRSMSPERQRYSNASSSLSEALLRAATGAGVNESEARQKVAELTPQRGDSEAVKAQKMAGAAGYIEDLRARAGRALPGNLAAPRGTAAAAFGGASPMQQGGGIRPTTGQAPAIGTVRNGYRYTGGNPADRASWEKL